MRFSIHICEYLLVFRLDLCLIFFGQFGDLDSLLLVALIDDCLFLLFDEDAELLLFSCHLVKLFFELNDLLFALLKLGLGLGQVAFKIPNLLNLKCTVTYLRLL